MVSVASANNWTFHNNLFQKLGGFLEQVIKVKIIIMTQEFKEEFALRTIQAGFHVACPQ